MIGQNMFGFRVPYGTYGKICKFPDGKVKGSGSERVKSIDTSQADSRKNSGSRMNLGPIT